MRRTIGKTLIFALTLAAIAVSALTLAACGESGGEPGKSLPTEVINGGFETSDLSGWTVESGEAFDDDSVSSRKTFSYSYDSDHKQLAVNHTGNWYLAGKGYDDSRASGYTGSIRSRNFVLGGDGTVSVKIAGGALVTRKGENAPLKSKEKICFVGVYTADDDKLVHKFTNDYFFEHTEDYVSVEDYANGTCCTDNFYRYTADLSDYIGREAYIRIVDNDTDVYYGYISVDDIRVGDSDAQAEGAYFEKTRTYQSDVAAPSEYEIKNGGFETGSLAGWTVVSGQAFSNDGVNKNAYWWNENIPYCRDGKYHYGFYKPSEVGVLRSSEFVLGGSGYISYKLGGCENQALTYLRFSVKNGEEWEEVAKYSNFKYWNYQFPYVQNGMRLLNLVQYYADFSAYLGRTMRIEVVDENTSSSDLGCITLDSVQTYWETKPVWNTSVAFEAKVDPDLIEIEPVSEYQVKNGTFELGTLEGWTMQGEIGVVSSDSGWWEQNYPYNKRGTYLFTGINHESGTGTLTSSEFVLGGLGVISFRMGGGRNAKQCYISVLDAESGEELARFANYRFADHGTAGLNVNSFLANMVQYQVDLTKLGIELGTRLKLQVVDNAEIRWGLITVDSFITYYENLAQVPKKAFAAVNIKPDGDEIFGENDEHQILNGNFETGDLTGWTVVKNGTTADIRDCVIDRDDMWDEKLPFNNSGYFLSGADVGMHDDDTWTVRSSEFVVGGSGWISVRMGGRAAVVRVYTKDGTAIGEYAATHYSDTSFPYVGDGEGKGSWGDMRTYFIDLSDYDGQTLYLELCDEIGGGWGVATFDEAITYYETAPDIANGHDTVRAPIAGNLSVGITYGEVDLAWREAVNRLAASQN